MPDPAGLVVTLHVRKQSDRTKVDFVLEVFVDSNRLGAQMFEPDVDLRLEDVGVS